MHRERRSLWVKHLAGRKEERKTSVLMHLCLHCNAVVRSVAKTSRANEEAEIIEDWSDLREDEIIKAAGWKLQRQDERSFPSAEVCC